MNTDSDHNNRLLYALASLDGLSIGDAFGENFFLDPDVVGLAIMHRSLPVGPWMYTDDTVMAISIVENLSNQRKIDQDILAEFFACRYHQDPKRGYGGTAHKILRQIWAGEPWREVSRAAFGGMGSMGNGGAMRAAPIGAYFFDNFNAAAENARLSAEVTHAHQEGQAGAIAVAIAAAYVARALTKTSELFETVLRYTPNSETRAKIQQASLLPLNYDVQTAVSALGNGSQVISQDTVPFALWCTARHFARFEEAMWFTVSGLGDRDTTCAIVGGILAANPDTIIPAEWLAAREPLERFSKNR